jgi:hypothetical protein
MDFNDTPEEAAWRAECQAWLAANAPKVAGNGVGALGDGMTADYLKRAQ